MGDLMRPLTFDQLMTWAHHELATDGSIFGVRQDRFWRAEEPRRITDSFGHTLAVPLGPAAGPHTQLAGNIIASYLAGARFMELKTVQKMDGEQIRHAVPKPCIETQDEGYNCEWSTELTVPQAYDEYVRAYVAIAVLAKELDLGSIDDVAFNISVGYDLDGIKGEKIDTYLTQIIDASGTAVWAECLDWVRTHLDTFTRFTSADLDALSPRISDSVTLSTLHGCPADEIERIAAYLLTEKNLHTFVKCNPTMLGYDYARSALDRLGFDYIQFDDHHFTADLQFDDAVPMFRRLTDLAASRGLRFGVKLTNTFPVQVAAGELPSEEMYMSGRSLYVLSLSLAQKLSHAFEGTLPISFSGGIDAQNIAQVLRTGIQPVTVATTLLKPGGVLRLSQLADEAHRVMTDYSHIDVAALDQAVEEIFTSERYHKRWREKIRSRKTTSPLPLTDCYKAPCEHGGCPIEQQIPEYLRLTAAGRLDEAFDIIALDNTAPTITGVLCSEQCREHCTRLDYDISIDMRGVKLAAADGAQHDYIAATIPPPVTVAQKVAVIGAGPAGIAAAMFLRRHGIDVDVFEKLDGPYGVVEYIIPKFRIDRAQIRRDYEMAVALGVTFHFNADPAYDVHELRRTYSHVIVATGAWGRCPSPVTSGQENVIDAFEFLWDTQNEGRTDYGRRIAVIGAGDVAMDCVRTASRLPGCAAAELVYRRTEAFMPATQHEVNLVRAENLTMHELLAPISYDGSMLRVERMELADVDAGGRRSVRGTGEFLDMPCDTVIAATGATIDADGYRRNGVDVDGWGRPVVDADFCSSVPGVYVIGDGRRGPRTIVEAIADAKVACRAILADHGLTADYTRPHPTVHQPPAPIYGRRGLLIAQINGKDEGSRCLTCQDICDVCTEVCPNRANVAVVVPGLSDPKQIVHIDGLCNECHTCGIFCPHAGLPYKDKTTVFWSRADFDDSTNPGLLPLGGDRYLVRTPNGTVVTTGPDMTDAHLPADMTAVLHTLINTYDHLLAPATAAAAAAEV
ncbi:putative oxidoreductase YgfK [Austwickia sp. TVS 96-490-7B]|uniref:putative selenate reductase subunit YgfK n=1 Tax=Austwickia sp. TVS 96-490-7B TaxID=2830843 RepID=UPI001C560E36|nr:putative selenate reductase subunit YgfK [Austwickia sp. TVS 96-490-7B]MBW3086997.1 putative oxidoreductase YgfK [Austwickia sp. TVS 96-490-7B]